MYVTSLSDSFVFLLQGSQEWFTMHIYILYIFVGHAELGLSVGSKCLLKCKFHSFRVVLQDWIHSCNEESDLEIHRKVRHQDHMQIMLQSCHHDCGVSNNPTSQTITRRFRIFSVHFDYFSFGRLASCDPYANP
jgi:hypothetical protein